MTAIRLSAKTVARRARAYRGTDGNIPKTEIEFTPVTDDMPACPVCGGGVRRVNAIHTDREAGIVQGKTKVVGSHAYGGSKAKYGVICPGAGTAA